MQYSGLCRQLGRTQHAASRALLLELLKRSAVTSNDVFDLQIVATMQANNIRRIYTFNTSDFQRFPELTVVTP